MVVVTKQEEVAASWCPSCFTSSLCSSLKHFTSVACAKRSPTQAPRWSQGLQEDSQPVSIFWSKTLSAQLPRSVQQAACWAWGNMKNGKVWNGGWKCWKLWEVLDKWRICLENWGKMERVFFFEQTNVSGRWNPDPEMALRAAPATTELDWSSRIHPWSSCRRTPAPDGFLIQNSGHWSGHWSQEWRYVENFYSLDWGVKKHRWASP